MRFRKIMAYVLACIMLSSIFTVDISAKTDMPVNETKVISASKTAQWTANGKGDDAKNYDLLISYYSANYYQTAYVGFDLPDDFQPEFVQSAKLKLYTSKLGTPVTAAVYGAEYDAFENNGLYTTNANIPVFDSSAIVSSITPAPVGEAAECDVTNYLKSASGDVAFRIACGTKAYTDWYIGSCNNAFTPPQLEIEYDNGEGPHTVPERIDYENGSILFAPSGSFEVGENITLMVAPAEHYKLDSLVMDGTPVKVNADNTYTFSMPARNITENYIKASFTLADYIKTRNIYEDNMLLQRDKPIYI